jgi:hypothetical protein
MSNNKFNQTLSTVTNIQVIKWIRTYNGDNSFLNGCKKRMVSNHPLTLSQFDGLKRCYAYFLLNPNTSNKKPEDTNKEIENLING